MLIIINLLRGEGQIKIFHFKCNSQILKKDQRKKFSPGHSEGKGAWGEKKQSFLTRVYIRGRFHRKGFFFFMDLMGSDEWGCN